MAIFCSKVAFNIDEASDSINVAMHKFKGGHPTHGMSNDMKLR
jgi:hypothetical protein